MKKTIEWEEEQAVAPSGLEQFKTAISRLAFREVDYEIHKREDAVALETPYGKAVTRDEPGNFSSVAATLSLADWDSERVRYSFYYGKTTGGVYFCKTSRGARKVYFTPAFPKDHFFGRPLPHETIVGIIVPSDNGGLRYEWWNCATKADQRFVDIILGHETFSPQKIETKLTVGGNRLLFHLVMALHFFDVDHFVNLARSGQKIDEGRRRFPVMDWLYLRVNAIAPDFCRGVLGKI